MCNNENKGIFDLSALQAELEMRFGPAVAQDIVDQVRRGGRTAKAPDYMDVKAMSEMVEKFRAQAMMAVWRLKEWRRQESDRKVEENLIELEGVYLERQCEDAVKLYRLANSGYFNMYRRALAAFSVPVYQSAKAA